MKKIYYIANARMPTERAHGIQLAKMCEAFLDIGVPLTLVVPKRKTVGEQVASFYGLAREIPIVKLPIIDTFLFGRLGFIFGTISFMASYSVFLLRKKLSGEDFVVYTIDMDQFSFLPLIIFNIPYVIEVHDAKPKRFLFRLLFRRARAVMVINRLIMEKIHRYFNVPKHHIFVVPNAIDPNFMNKAQLRDAFRKKEGIPPKAFLLLYVGKFYEWKGFEILYQLAQDLDPSVNIGLVGGSKEELEELIGKHVPENIFCFGARPYEEVPSWIEASDALLVLGTKANEYSYYHTSPMKLFEYLVSGRPIIASKTPAICDIVSEKEVLFYMPDDKEDLKRAILRVQSNPASFHNRVKAAKELSTSFTWHSRAKKINQFIKDRLS